MLRFEFIEVFECKTQIPRSNLITQDRAIPIMHCVITCHVQQPLKGCLFDLICQPISIIMELIDMSILRQQCSDKDRI